MVIRMVLVYFVVYSLSRNKIQGAYIYIKEALVSVMCDVIKIRLKGRIATRSEKGKYQNSCRAVNFKARITKF